MSTFRAVFGWIGQDGGSWNEIMYVDGGSISTVPLSTKTINARLKLAHPLTLLRSVRFVQVDAPRVTRNQLINLFGTATGTASGPAPNDNAAVFSLSSLAGGSRKLWMRGIPDAWIIKDNTTGRDAPVPDMQKAFSYWVSSAALDGYGIRQLQGITPGPLSPLKILKVDGSAGNGTSAITLAAAPGYPFPARVLIGGVSKKDLPGLNGQFSLVSAPAGPVVTVPYQTPGLQIINGGNGHMRQALYSATHVFDPPSSGFDHFGAHSTRTANFRSRGARRAQRLRTSL